MPTPPELHAVFDDLPEKSTTYIVVAGDENGKFRMSYSGTPDELLHMLAHIAGAVEVATLPQTEEKYND